MTKPKLEVRTYEAEIKRWVDGDTVDLVVDLGFYVSTHIRVRLARINAPEMSTDDGKCLKQIVATRYPPGFPIILSCHGRDRYGRWVAELSYSNINISDVLLKEGLAELYKERDHD